MKALWRQSLCVLAISLSVGGCSTISDWFDKDEKTLVTELQPIENTVATDIQWQQQVGEGVSGFFSRLKPTVGYGAVFSASRDGTIKRFDLTSGELSWAVNFPSNENASSLFSFAEKQKNAVSGGLTTAYEKLFFGTENGDVVALDVNSGELVWQSSVGGEVLASPAVDNNLVVVSTLNGKLVALDAATGEEQWVHTSEVPPLSLRGTAAPITMGGGVLFGSALGKVSVFILAEGQLAWEQSLASNKGRTELEGIADVDAQPLVLGGVIYSGAYDGTLAALEFRTGRIIWKREYRSFQQITALGNTLFVTDKDSVVYAIDRLSGVELWSQTGFRGRGVTAPSASGEFVLVGDSYGYLHWLSSRTGEMVGRKLMPSSKTGFAVAPVVSDNMFYTQSRSGRLFAIKAP